MQAPGGGWVGAGLPLGGACGNSAAVPPPPTAPPSPVQTLQESPAGGRQGRRYPVPTPPFCSHNEDAQPLREIWNQRWASALPAKYTVSSTFQIRPNPEIWGEMPKFLQFVSDGGTQASGLLIHGSI